MSITIQLRFLRPSKTTTKPDRLQYRVVHFTPNFGEYSMDGWQNVPVVVVDDVAYNKSAPAQPATPSMIDRCHKPDLLDTECCTTSECRFKSAHGARE